MKKFLVGLVLCFTLFSSVPSHATFSGITKDLTKVTGVVRQASGVVSQVGGIVGGIGSIVGSVRSLFGGGRGGGFSGGGSSGLFDGAPLEFLKEVFRVVLTSVLIMSFRVGW